MPNADESWVKIAVALADDPKLQRVSPSARWLYVALLCYCGKHLTDGVLDDRSFASVRQAQRIRSTTAEQLVHAHLLVRTTTGYLIPNYLNWNRSRAEVEAKRRRNRDRMRSVREHEDQQRDERVHAHDGDVEQVVRPTEGEGEGEGEQDHPLSLQEGRFAQAGDEDGDSFCTCDVPAWDVEHDDGCRRCGRPVALPVDEPGAFVQLDSQDIVDEHLSPAAIVREALNVLADRDVDAHLARGGRIVALDKFWRSCRQARERDHAAELHAALHRDPSLAPAELADTLGRSSGALPPPDQRSTASPLDGIAAAQAAIRERNAARDRGEACPRCEGMGVYLDDEHNAHECPCRWGVAVDAIPDVHEVDS